MTKFRLVLVLGIALLVGGQSLFGQRKKEKREQKEMQVKGTIESGHFIVDVNRAVPMGGRAVNLTSSYLLELRGDSVLSYLPYFGRAYSAPYGGGKGLDFIEIASEYDLSYDKKGVAQIKFRVRTDEDNYAFNVQIFPNGSSTINVTPVNKQGITFYGEVAPKKEK